MELQARLDALIAFVNNLQVEHWTRNNYTFSPPPTVEIEKGEKWAKVWVYEEREAGKKHKSRIYAFIALQTFTNKTLGTVTAGDIHKPESTKAPAKHKRGNIFAENFDNCLNDHGPVYLK
jgi:hypothetical protein